MTGISESFISVTMAATGLGLNLAPDPARKIPAVDPGQREVMRNTSFLRMSECALAVLLSHARRLPPTLAESPCELSRAVHTDFSQSMFV